MLNEYLKMMDAVRGAPPPGYRYASLEGLVLAEGREFESAPLTPDQHRYIREVIARDGGKYPWKACFSTSQRIVAMSDFDRRLSYIEGWAQGALIPVHHGWLALDGERVIDLTWRTTGLQKVRRKLEATRIFGEFPKGWAYRGIHVADRETIVQRAVQHREWASILDNWREGYPLLRVA